MSLKLQMHILFGLRFSKTCRIIDRTCCGILDQYYRKSQNHRVAQATTYLTCECIIRQLETIGYCRTFLRNKFEILHILEKCSLCVCFDQMFKSIRLNKSLLLSHRSKVHRFQRPGNCVQTLVPQNNSSCTADRHALTNKLAYFRQTSGRISARISECKTFYQIRGPVDLHFH